MEIERMDEEIGKKLNTNLSALNNITSSINISYVFTRVILLILICIFYLHTSTITIRVYVSNLNIFRLYCY